MQYETYKPNHRCDDCQSGNPIYDNYEEITGYDCLLDYEVDSEEYNKVYKDDMGDIS